MPPWIIRALCSTRQCRRETCDHQDAARRGIRDRIDGRWLDRSRHFGELPGIAHDDIVGCLAYARDMLSSERVYPTAA